MKCPVCGKEVELVRVDIDSWFLKNPENHRHCINNGSNININKNYLYNYPKMYEVELKIRKD